MYFMESEEYEVASCIKKYISAVIDGEHANAIEAWHIQGKRVMYDASLDQIVFSDSPADEKYAAYTPDPAIKQQAEIRFVDVTGSAAIVKLYWKYTMQQLQKDCYDYLMLIKAHSQWKIVGKVSHIENISDQKKRT